MMNWTLARALCGAIMLAVTMSTALAQETAPSAGADLRVAGPVVMVADLERSLRFYTEGLGMRVANRLSGNPGPGATVVARAGERSPFVLLRQRDGTARAEPPVEIGNALGRIMLTVRDAKEVAARLRSAGYEPSTPNARGIFFVTDPDGYRYEVMQIDAH